MLTSWRLRPSAAFVSSFSTAVHQLGAASRTGAACRCTAAVGEHEPTAFSTAAAQNQAAVQTAADAGDGGGAFTSLHDAARSPTAVRRLDLTASPQLRCSNLLCDKIGEPCICRISRVFEQLEGVQELILRGNALTELPPSTWQLASLQLLDLSDNQLSAVPPHVAQLQQLQALKLTGNNEQLSLPYTALAQLPQLRELYVDRGIRQRMVRDPAAAPLLHWLRF